MKVLHIIDSLGLGGAQTLVKSLFETQHKNNNIYLFSLRKRKINIEINHKNIFLCKSNSKYSFFPLFELRKLIMNKKIEVLHCHLFRSQFFGWLLKLLFFPKIKLIFHEHGEIFQSHFIYNFFMKLSKNNVNKIIAVSTATKKKLKTEAKIPNSKIKVLYNFVNLDKFNRKNITWNIQEEKKKLGVKKEEFVIGFVGRLNKVKGCEYLIKSLPYLSFNYKVLIVGDGLEKEELINLSKKLNVSEKVKFLGYQKKVLRSYSVLDVLVMPSLSEACPMSLFEAQASGVPIIASNAPALNELIYNSKNGLLFKTKDSLNLSKKIELIYTNKRLRKKIIKNGLKDSEKYNLKNYLKKIDEIYE